VRLLDLVRMNGLKKLVRSSASYDLNNNPHRLDRERAGEGI
jgi:hypothetical protein